MEKVVALQGPAALQSASRPPNLELIDRLRCLAILLVLLHHLFGINFHWRLPWENNLRVLDAYGRSSPVVHFFYLGWAGVPLFFVLSGFCIHWSCLRARRPFEVQRFLWQRFWRIYPAYFIALVTISAVEFHGRLDAETSRQFWTHVFMVQNFSGDTFFGINGPFWSIAVEVQLYLLYPLLLVIKRRAGWRGCFVLIGGLGLVWRVIAVSAWGLPDHSITPAMTSPWCTWADWLLGAYIAERFASNQRAFPANRTLPWLALACFVASTLYRPLIVFSFFAASLASALFLDQMLHRRPLRAGEPAGQRRPVARFAVWFGLISYSFYLWHEPILLHSHSFIERYLHTVRLPGVVFLPVALGLPSLAATLLAYISYRLFEKPGVRLGRWCQSALASCRAWIGERAMATVSHVTQKREPESITG